MGLSPSTGLGCYCRLEYALNDYRETASLIGSCGHDTSDLVLAIAEVENALVVLRAERVKAVVKFKEDGVCFIVDESKRKAIEEAVLR